MIIREHEKGDLLELSCNQLFNSISDANKFVNKIVNKWDKKGGRSKIFFLKYIYLLFLLPLLACFLFL